MTFACTIRKVFGKDMMDWIISNKEWIFSGIGVLVIGFIFGFLKLTGKRPASEAKPTSITITNTNSMGNSIEEPKKENNDSAETQSDLNVLKAKTHILFIDDDQKFKVVDILKRNGWMHTRRVSDVTNIDDSCIADSHVLFVDVQGVGKRLQFRDEGLGLALAIKDRHPEKKVVIYSAQTQGERFHEALRKADDFLAKNADPYEFEQLASSMATAVWGAEA